MVDADDVESDDVESDDVEGDDDEREGSPDLSEPRGGEPSTLTRETRASVGRGNKPALLSPSGLAFFAIRFLGATIPKAANVKNGFLVLTPNVVADLVTQVGTSLRIWSSQEVEAALPCIVSFLEAGLEAGQALNYYKCVKQKARMGKLAGTEQNHLYIDVKIIDDRRKQWPVLLTSLEEDEEALYGREVSEVSC